MPWLTVAQNLALVDKTASGERLSACLSRVGLKDCADLFPNQLSGGMQRRVALLRAFLVAPQLLLMDEPFESLDLPTADQLRAQRARVSVSGLGDVAVWAEKELSVSVSGIGTVDYWGSPNVQRHSSGIARINERGPKTRPQP